MNAQRGCVGQLAAEVSCLWKQPYDSMTHCVRLLSRNYGYLTPHGEGLLKLNRVRRMCNDERQPSWALKSHGDSWHLRSSWILTMRGGGYQLSLRIARKVQTRMTQSEHGVP